MLIKKEQTNENKNSDQCTVWEYPFDTKKIRLVVSLIDGRYPEKKLL